MNSIFNYLVLIKNYTLNNFIISSKYSLYFGKCLKMSISIVIPTYKRVDYLRRLLDSIFMQTHQNYEVIVIDDYSPNEKEYDELIKHFKLKFKELTYIRNASNNGAPFSRNLGIKIAKYDLLALVDDDDEWLPKKLEEQIYFFNKTNNNLGIVYTWTDMKDENNEIVHSYRSIIEGSSKNKILKSNFIPSSSIMVKKSHIINAGLFDEKMSSCQDWDMWTRMILLGSECEVVRSVQTICYKHKLESIGSSKKSYIGYKMFFRKHFLKALFINPLIAGYYIYSYIGISMKRKC